MINVDGALCDQCCRSQFACCVGVKKGVWTASLVSNVIITPR